MKRYLLFLVLLLCVDAWATPCDEGGCQYEPQGTMCWSVDCDCFAVTQGYVLTNGPPVPISTSTLDCNACSIDEGEITTSYTAQYESGISFCVSLGAVAGWQVGCSMAGVGLQGSGQINTTSQWCVNTKSTWTGSVDITCYPGTHVQGTVVVDRTPVTITATVDYWLNCCYTWNAHKPACGPQPTGAPLSMVVYCGPMVSTFADQSINTSATATDIACPGTFR